MHGSLHFIGCSALLIKELVKRLLLFKKKNLLLKFTFLVITLLTYLLKSHFNTSLFLFPSIEGIPGLVCVSLCVWPLSTPTSLAYGLKCQRWFLSQWAFHSLQKSSCRFLHVPSFLSSLLSNHSKVLFLQFLLSKSLCFCVLYVLTWND